MNKHIVELTFSSNIKPRFFKNGNLKNKNIYLINSDFFIFFITLNFYLKKKISNYNTSSDFLFKKLIFYIKPLKKKTITYLRAPYRYKLARNQVTFSRYFVTCQIVFYSKIYKQFLNVATSITYNKKFINFIKDLSSNLSNLVYVKYSSKVEILNFFNKNE